jgi:hypothetical protein
MSTLDNIRRGELKRLLLHRHAVSKVEVHNEVENILAGRARWTAAALGWRMNLTFDEKIRLAIRTMACVDRSKTMMERYFRERKRERDRMRCKRKKQTSPRDLSPMAKQIAQLVAEKSMRSPSLLMVSVKRAIFDRRSHDRRSNFLRLTEEIQRARAQVARGLLQKTPLAS